MKRRIIAALTALVMVVTMIPASAFAATSTNTADYVDKLIASVVYTEGSVNKVAYADKAKLEEANKAYQALAAYPEELKKVENEDLLFAAMDAFETLSTKVTAFEKAYTALKPGTIVADTETPGEGEMTMTAAAGTLMWPYNEAATITGSFKTADGTTEVSLVGYERDKIFNADGVALMNAMATSEFANALNELKDFSDSKDIANVVKEMDASNYNAETTYVNAVDELDKIDDVWGKYFVYGKNYDNYLTFATAYNKYNDLHEFVTETFVKKDVSDIKAMSDTVRAEFEKVLAEADEVVAEYGEKLSPDFSDKAYNANESKNGFIDEYKFTKNAYKVYNDLADIEKEVRRLLAFESSVDKMTYAQANEVYADILKLEKRVEGTDALTAVVTDGNKIATLKDKVVKRINEFDKDIEKEYAKKLLDAINALPANANDATRADAEKVDAVIDIFNAYVEITKDGTAIQKLVQKNDNVYALADNADARTIKLTTADGTNVKKELAELDKNAWKKLVAVNEVVVEKAVADFEAGKKVYDIVSTKQAAQAVTSGKISKEAGLLANDGTLLAFPSTNSNYITNAKTAQEIIDKYYEEYAKLTGVAKEEYDAAVEAGRFALAGKNLDKAIAEVQTEINKIVVSDQFIKDGIAVKAMIETLLDTPVGRVEYELESQRSQIAAIEKYFENKAFKSYYVTTYGALTEYENRVDYVNSFVAESSAVKAMIKSIDALRVIKEDEAVTKADVEAVITAYETVVKNYEALSNAEKAAVTNYAKLDTVKGGIKVGLNTVFEAEVEKIGNITAGITDAQIDQTNSVNALVKAYGPVTAENKDAKGYFNPADSADANAKLKAANDAIEKAVTDAATKEVLAIKPFIEQVNSYAALNKTNAADFIKAVDQVNALSDEALEVFKTTYKSVYDAYTTKVEAQYKNAKALLLDYATVTVADQEYTGEALTPAVVVKNSDGTVIEASEYTVAYSANTNPGTATVIVTAKADAKVAGSVQGTFKITIDKPVKADITKVDTDYGIVRVYFDRNEEVNGDAVKFQVQYKKTTSDKWIVKYPTAGYDYLTLRNLTKNGKYDVRVRAYFVVDGEKVFGDFSDVKTVYANRNGAKSGIMYKAVIKNLTTKNGSVTMTVNPVKYQTVPQGVTWKYSYKKYGSQYTTWSTAKTTKSTSYTFKNLKKGTRYVFRAQYTYTSAVDGKTAVNSNYSVYKNIVVK